MPNGYMHSCRLSAAAAWDIARILEDSPHPAHAARRRGGPIAWKTGTSFGFRDAWAVGFAGGRVVGVWVGRPDGTPRPGHYGVRSAAPLLFEIFDTLPSTAGLVAAVPVGSATPPSLQPLPPALTYFQPRDRTPAGVPVSIAYPRDGSEIEQPDGRPIALRAKGGKRPLVWLIDGRPIPASTPPAGRRLAAGRPWIRDRDGDRRRGFDGTGPSAGARNPLIIPSIDDPTSTVIVLLSAILRPARAEATGRRR